MQIYVCVKHVPDSGAIIELDGQKGYKTDNVKYIPNPFDEYGIEEGLKLREKHGGEVVIFCVGPEGALSTIQAALAMGADRAIHIVTEQLFTHSCAVAKDIAQQIKEEGTPDVIFTGKQSIDSEGGQFPYFLAQDLGLPVINDVSGLNIDGTQVMASREIDGGKKQKIATALPCVIGATRGLNEPRYPKLPDIMKAKKKPVKKVASSNSGGLCSSPLIESLEIMPERSGAKTFNGSLTEQVQELIRTLRDEERVI